MLLRYSTVIALFYFVQFRTSAQIASRRKSLNLAWASPVYDTIIVGLGTSGLSAYSKLARRGKHVLGLEAAHRIGGRVNTIKFGEGVAEAGAEWIQGTKNSVTYELARANNVTIKVQEMIWKIYRSDGSVVDADLMDDIISECMKEPGHDVEAQSAGQFYTDQCRKYLSKIKPKLMKNETFFNELLVFLDFYRSTSDASDDWHQVSSKSKYGDLDDVLTASWHKYGYKTLFEILLNTYNYGPGLPKTAKKLKKEVTTIYWTQDPNAPIVVKCKDRSEYKANNVIVTVSLGVLKEQYATMFIPSLPKKKVKAINNVSMGLLDKVLLSFDKIWWPQNATVFGFIWREADKAKLSNEDVWTAGVRGMSQSMASHNVWEIWLVGETARYVEILPDDVVKTKMLEVIRRFMGTEVPEPCSIFKSTWFTNPLTRGSYTFDNIESSQNPDARQNLASPLLDSAKKPRVLFAGEATNVEHFGTVHGAAETGIREANRLLGDHKNTIY